MARDEQLRAAWLTIGGYIAGADGLSTGEAEALGRSAASPDFGFEACVELLVAAAAGGLPEDSLSAVRATELGDTVASLIEIAHAVAVDGLSQGEWARFREVSSRLVDEARVEPLVRLVVAELDARKARGELFFESEAPA